MSGGRISEKRIGEKVSVAPKVSVVVPAYNCAEFIGATLDSVLAQTFKNYEIIIVNDGSPDTEVLEKTLRPYFERIVYIKQANGGAARARNTAIENARAGILAFLDGDDVWLPEYLESQLDFIAKNDFEMVYADALLFGGARAQKETFMEKSPSSGTVDFQALIVGRCSVIMSGTLAYKQKIIDAGCFDENLPRAAPEDFDLWLRLARSGARIGYQKKVLLKYRIRPDGLTGGSVQRARRFILSLEKIEEKFDLTPAEKASVTQRRAEAEAEFNLEVGKAHLLREEFAEARQSFRAANEFYRKPKLKIINFGLLISPKTIVRIFKKRRAEELPFVATKF